MPRESLARRRDRTVRLLDGLRGEYTDADCALHHESALELLIATVLSAQCTDERVNQVTPTLFARYPDAASLAEADASELESIIHSLGFFRNKTRSLIGLGKALTERHGGDVPSEMDALVKLPGVGRKTANVILGTWFGIPSIPVDTHVTRLAGRLGLSQHRDPVKIETDLHALAEESDWTFFSHALIWHGRTICHARKPECGRCVLSGDCPGAVL
ncbi:MAG: endonuclease III [Acidobacteriota bacterium]|nr:endonuclease III [Acidobacteriota bacterium]